MDITAIAARLSRIADALQALQVWRELTLAEFLADSIIQLATERQIQVAIQAALDIGSILLAAASSQIPTTYKEIFTFLANQQIIPLPLAEKLVRMAGFRNILVHMYLDVDMSKLYQFLQNDLGDFEEYAHHVAEYLEKNH
ncbi:MAG: DUF86 domain-containing protein [Chloroflexi bacterium]|nr:DUF86 domain-containing protein [Chloroflexota bacterium]MBP8057443.1 DUF86 domain-containing protein [Chloroflexota bacterium]